MSKKPKTPPPKKPPAPPANPEDRPLTPAEQRFVEEYLIDRKPAAAYRRIHPNCSHRTAWYNGRDIRARPHVAREIRDAIRDQSLRTQVRADELLKEIARVAFSDVYELYDPQTGLLRHARHIPYETRKAVASVKVQRTRTTRRTTHNRSRRTRTESTVVESVVEYRLWNKNDAMARLARHLGLDTEILPLEALLRALPTNVSSALRAALAQNPSQPPALTVTADKTPVPAKPPTDNGTPKE